MAERIECAAIWHRGRVYQQPRPSRHGDVIRAMSEMGYKAHAMTHQGFTTDAGRFVDRKEALKIAEAAGQILVKTGGLDELYSEDVW